MNKVGQILKRSEIKAIKFKYLYTYGRAASSSSSSSAVLLKEAAATTYRNIFTETKSFNSFKDNLYKRQYATLVGVTNLRKIIILCCGLNIIPLCVCVNGHVPLTNASLNFLRLVFNLCFLINH